MNIITLIKTLLPKRVPIPLGRWRIENCNKQINNKIDLSNEDHCGPCGQYALDKIELQLPSVNLTTIPKSDAIPKSEPFIIKPKN